MESLQDVERVSLLMSKFIERELLGTREIMDCRRRTILIEEDILNNDDDYNQVLICGSRSEGSNLIVGSDVDIMFVDKHVEVLYPEERIPPGSTGKTVLYVRQVDCRPGFVALQLGKIGQRRTYALVYSRVQVENDVFISSDMYRENFIRECGNRIGYEPTSNGPSVTVSFVDSVPCFHMNSWPKQAYQWVTRPRLYGWPTQAMIDKIVQNGCYLVPVGDKCSKYTAMQWRLSFAPAERLLIHSFSHIQMKLYFLLKYFLKQMKVTLRNVMGKEDDDILCSYHLKTVMFCALENSHPQLWQEQNLLYCFWFCFNILISSVRVGHFSQYFIPANNMFQRKVHGQNQHKLVHILEEFHSKKLLSLLNIHQKACGVMMLEYVCNPVGQAKLMRAQTVQEIEYKHDFFLKSIFLVHREHILKENHLTKSLNLLMRSDAELDELMSFLTTLTLVSESAKREAHKNLTDGLTNKTRYQTLRKCKHRLTLCASMGTYILELATLCFLTGNYSKALQMCRHITSRPSYDTGVKLFLPKPLDTLYKKQYCGKGHDTIHRLKKTLSYQIYADSNNIHLPHIHLEVSKNNLGVLIPSLPYALFLSFLCCHELRDRKGRDEALRNLIVLKYDECHGKHWMTHTLLGICYETIGDYRGAIRAYLISANLPKIECHYNPAPERIDAVLRLKNKNVTEGRQLHTAEGPEE